MATSVRGVIANLNGYTERQTRRLVLNIRAELVDKTPRDTGWARNNWIPSVGGPPQGLIRSSEGSVGVAQSQARAGEAHVLRYRLIEGDVYVSNGVPYIQRLNRGHSQQAPAGFVEAAVAQAVANTR